MTEWQVKRDGEVVAHGPMATFPELPQRKALIAAGYKIYVDGQAFRGCGKISS